MSVPQVIRARLPGGQLFLSGVFAMIVSSVLPSRVGADCPDPPTQMAENLA